MADDAGDQARQVGRCDDGLEALDLHRRSVQQAQGRPLFVPNPQRGDFTDGGNTDSRWFEPAYSANAVENV